VTLAQDHDHVDHPDRRAANKARHRTAILEAARALIAEQGGPRFSVDELAERADVSRRTVFNHFASVDDILVTLCTELLAVVVDDFEAQINANPAAEVELSALFDELEKAMRSPALVDVINAIVTIIGETDANSARAESLKQVAFNRIVRELIDEVARRSSVADPIDVEILLAAVMAGIVVVADRWVAQTGATTDPSSLAVWDRLVAQLFDRLGAGYRSAD